MCYRENSEFSSPQKIFLLIYFWYSLGLRKRCVILADSFDNRTKFRFEWSSTNKESINVGLSNKSSAVSGICWSTILNSSGSSHFCWYIISKPWANVGVSILSDLGSGSFSSANGPDWLISDDDISPVSYWGFDGIELCLKNIICSSSFSLLKSLTNA